MIRLRRMLFPTHLPEGAPEPRWPMLSATALVAVGAATLLASPERSVALRQLGERRALIVAHAADPKYREAWELAVLGRQLDRVLPRDARVFLSGMVGRSERPRLYYFFFLRNYLFPREVEISLDRKPVFHGAWFEGIDAASPAQARASGFDVLLRVTSDGAIQVTMLAPPAASPDRR